jgi:hypothetical protein
VSIASAVREAFPADPTRRSLTFRAGSAAPDAKSALELITTWIPTEVVAVYVSLVGLFAPASDLGRWVLFGIGAALVPSFVFIDGALLNKRASQKWEERGNATGPPRISLRRLGLVTVLAIIAFVAWSMALPNTPFLTWFSDPTRYGGGAVVVLSLAMPKLSELLDLRLPAA